ncbi:hypothetical protein PMAYCL1PPCAC_18105 [Pristionchus mayeri]|uniref:Uncharacterized protein n=1 Tax=Pristionchus mayeri TaxID=1317129 RepID=A0AAN5I1A2_9BILA|nr:hypothetical protein PMAYCL1PPCAC_18105 [Pristionchus mayeri]
MSNRVYLEEADHPPPSYYDDSPKKKDPKEWAKAPEFVPRSRLLHQAFSLDEGSPSGYANPLDSIPQREYHQPVIEQLPFPHVPFFGGPPSLPPLPQFGLPFPPMGLSNGTPMGTPMNPSSLPFLPQGYSANITNINTGPGPPIPAIVLKKKRRKRHKNHTNSLILPCPEEREDPKEEEREQRILEENGEMRGASDDTTRSIASIPESSMVRGSSCPDLSQDQLTLWENLLYSRVCEEKSPPPPPAPRNGMEARKSSAYDVMSRALREVAEGYVEGLTSSEVRKMDREINGNVMSDSLIVTRLQDHNNGNLESDASPLKTLSTELNEIAFRPQMTKYGYPQYKEDRAHFATFNYGSGMTSSKIVDMVSIQKSDEDEDRLMDSLEGFNIRVNHFDQMEDGDLSESDLPPPSRFEQIHWALQNKAAQYREAPLRPPDRVCCSIQ